MYYALAIVGILIVAFIWWLSTSVVRGAKRRIRRLGVAIGPIADRLREKQPVTAEEVLALAKLPQYRPVLHRVLQQFERLDLFPQEYLSRTAQAEGELAYWLMHPNELQDPPAAIELVWSFPQEQSGKGIEFPVFRYRMPEGHWAGSDWLLGVVGPITDGVPYAHHLPAFSRSSDSEKNTKPEELVDWWIGMLKAKGASV